MYVTATSAHTTNANTAETDLLPEVMHTVSYSTSDGECGSVQIMAKDPMDAIRKVNRMQVSDLPKQSTIKL
jgi:hypothetical protein